MWPLAITQLYRLGRLYIRVLAYLEGLMADYTVDLLSKCSTKL